MSTCKPIFIHKNTKGFMGQIYSCSTKWVQNVLVILNIYGARAISQLLCDSAKALNLSHVKWKLVEVDQYPLIKISKALWDYNIHTLLDGDTCCDNSPFFGAKSIFLLSCVTPDTEYESREIKMRTSQPIFTHKNILKYLWENDIYTIQNGKKYCGNYSYLWS